MIQWSITSLIKVRVSFQQGFQTHFIAFCEQDAMHGVVPVSGLHGWQVYLIFLRCSSVIAATVLSSKSISIVSIFSAF
jgi:hypothetical protein